MKALILRSVGMQRDLGQPVVTEIFETMGSTASEAKTPSPSHGEE